MGEALDGVEGVELRLAEVLAQEDAVDFALVERVTGSGEVGQEAQHEDVDVGPAEVVAGIGAQGRFKRGHGVEDVGTGANGTGIEGCIEERGAIEPLEQVLGKDADRGEAREKAGIERGQPDDDGAQVRGPHLDTRPCLAEARVALEVGCTDVVDREGDIEGADGGAVVPAEVAVEAEGVGAAVLANLGQGGEVRQQAAVLTDAQEPGEDEAREVLVGSVVGSEERIDALPRADDALCVDGLRGGGGRGAGLGFRGFALGQCEDDDKNDRRHGCNREEAPGEEGALRGRNSTKHAKRLAPERG